MSMDLVISNTGITNTYFHSQPNTIMQFYFSSRCKREFGNKQMKLCPLSKHNLFKTAQLLLIREEAIWTYGTDFAIWWEEVI